MGRQVVAGLVLAILASPAAAQEASPCHELVVISAEWVATEAEPEPTRPLDLETPLLQVPAQFIVLDSIGRFRTRTTRPINDSNSAFPHSIWDRQGDSLTVAWTTGFVGWSGRFSLPDTTMGLEGGRPWVGLLRRFWDNHLGEPRGWWEYHAELRQISCPSVPGGVS